MRDNIYLGIFVLLFLLSILLVRVKNNLQESIKILKEEILLLEKTKLELEEKTKSRQINLMKQRRSDLNIHRDLLMNQSLKLRQDIAIFMKEIEKIER